MGWKGDVVELGCNTGDSSILITKLLQTHNSDKKLAVYDSFEGLPAAQPIDGTIYKEGYRRTSEDVLEENFRAHKLPVPEIHKGWFQDTLPNGLPDRISCLPRWIFYD
jgi:O-methyltransferase